MLLSYRSCTWLNLYRESTYQGYTLRRLPLSKFLLGCTLWNWYSSRNKGLSRYTQQAISHCQGILSRLETQHFSCQACRRNLSWRIEFRRFPFFLRLCRWLNILSWLPWLRLLLSFRCWRFGLRRRLKRIWGIYRISGRSPQNRRWWCLLKWFLGMKS